MANFSSKLLGNAVSSINAQQAVIANISNNIANVNTEGYARRKLILQTNLSNSAGLNLGSGVSVAELQRVSDNFLEQLLQDATSEANGFGVEDEYISRIEQLFSLDGSQNTIGPAITSFFTALDDLSLNPASIELRQEVIERGTDVATAISETYDGLADLQDEADRRLRTEVDVVNTLTSQIAELNGLITGKEAAGNVAADERDRRDLLMKQLSEKIGIEVVEQADGGVLISLPNGFPLVNGSTARPLELTVNPSFSPGTVPPSLSGGTLSYIVYDYSNGAGTTHLDLTQELSQVGGIIGGLLNIRGFNDAANTSAFDASGPLVDVASQVEAITRDILTRLNTTYLGPDRDGGTAGHQPSSVDLDGNTPGVYGLFTFAFTGTRDDDGNGLPDDLGAAALGIDNFSSILQFAISDPRAIAAGRDQSGGPPAAIVGAPGDNTNLTALSAEQFNNASVAYGPINLSGTLEESYNVTVGTVGNYRSRSALNLQLAEDDLLVVQSQRDELAGVSLDEEFTQLIKFQKAFEASARLIRIADEILEQLVNII